MFTLLYLCLSMFTRVYLCLHVYYCLLESGMIKGCGINNFPRQCPTWNHVSRRTSNGKPDDSSCASILDTQAPEKE